MARPSSEKPLRLVLAVAVSLVASATPGRAGDDGGLGAFFREQFGIGSDPQPTVDPGYDAPEDRPIIVRPRHRHMALRPVPTKIVVGPVAPISIYDDTTLRPGDAVMTAKGVRVFMGGHTAPYSEADFATLTDADGMPKQVEKELAVIDKAPRT